MENIQTESTEFKYAIVKDGKYLTRIVTMDLKCLFESSKLSIAYLFSHIDDAKYTAWKVSGDVLKVRVSLAITKKVKP